ncbi:hypothetical protein A3Q40_03428 [Rhodococcus sp. PBTS 1]|nr:hypothetical protein A3Q40_03428 [Rhodococcus sp. PBTS 1]
MDHGQFLLRGGLGDIDDEYPLLEQALSAQPNAGDGTTMVVLSPHQNNFEMPIDIEVFTTRPPDDADDWEQVCEDILRIGPEGILEIESTTMSPGEVHVEPGEYLVQVAGRGFVNYGWPGTTTPDDVWRIRLFPTDGTGPRPAVRWDMPGYGIPENAEPAPEPARTQDDEPRWITVLHEDGSHRMVARSELEERASQHLLDEWGGGPPIEKVTRYNGGQLLTKFDRPLVEAILETDHHVARLVAVYAAARACEFAGLADLPWVRPALDALGNNTALPAPFADPSQMGDAFARLESPDAVATTSVTITTSHRAASDYPFGANNEPRYMTIPALYSAQDLDPWKAAIETVMHASCAYGSRAAELHTAIKRDLPEMYRASRGEW